MLTALTEDAARISQVVIAANSSGISRMAPAAFSSPSAQMSS
jgi:hypothetical protein